MFREYVEEVESNTLPSSVQQVAFVQDYGISREMSDGSFVTTGNPFDIALSGDGFLSVKLENGDTAYTRNGHFAVSEDNTLILSTGQEVLDEDGNPIQLTLPGTGLVFAEDGTISTRETGPIGKLGIVTFDDTANLEKIGDNLFKTDQETKESQDFTIAQGMLENSNVQPIVEITKMINISRAYTSSAQLMNDLQKAEKDAINRIARFG